MNILMITTTDPAGSCINFANAINRYTEHRCRLITTNRIEWMNYEHDIFHSFDNGEEIRYLLKTADIIHFHKVNDNFKIGTIEVRDYLKNKKIVHHHHGHPHFRANSKQYREWYLLNKRKVLVSTPDLLRFIPEATYMPNVMPLNDVLYLPRAIDKSAVGNNILIGHSPTRRDLKNTEMFIEVVEELGRKYKNIKMLLIEQVTHKMCLMHKRICQIFLDHLQGYYGISSLEALSMGIPTIVGLDEWNIRHIKEFTGADKLPWIVVRNREELKRELVAFTEAPEARMEAGRLSRGFMEKYWNEKIIAERLIEIYENL